MASNSSLAQLYRNNSDAQFQFGMELMQAHLLPCRGQAILDLGCGTGRLSAELASQVGSNGRVVGIDPNKERVRVARERFGDNHAHLVFHDGHVGDAVRFGPFDTVFCNYVLHWVQPDNVQSTLRDIHECLKPGGRLIAWITTKPGELDVAYVSLATQRVDESLFGLCLRPLSFWRQECMDIGFEMETSYQAPDMCFTFPDVPSYFDFVKAYTFGVVDPANISKNDMKEFFQKHNIHTMNDKIVWQESHIRIFAKRPAL